MTTKQKKFILVTGGVISGIGKGVTASSIGVLLKMLYMKPTAIKIDPYLNLDAGTMSPGEHGEVFVLDDGSETDLDLGNYERFLDVKLTRDSNLTTGKIYEAVITKERKGEYLGKTVQIIPHITDEIMARILRVACEPVEEHGGEPDVCVIELGGTIGDIESMPFVEALRQLQLKVSRDNFCIVHVSMVPSIGEQGEQKTKPTQHSVKEMRALGLVPDFIVCRSATPVDESAREKISMFCNLAPECVLSIHDLPNIYQVPMLMYKQRFHTMLARRLAIGSQLSWQFYTEWDGIVKRIDDATDVAMIVLVGKYTNQQDSYLSVISALQHACIHTNQRLRLLMIESSQLEAEQIDTEVLEKLEQANGIIVPGGFGVRGIEGKIAAIRYARANRVPFLGICLGMQAAVIEYVRSVLNKPNANSAEFVPDIAPEDAAIVFMPEGARDKMGGTMRLGSRQTRLQAGSRVSELYDGAAAVDERHRHRYEVNPAMVGELEAHGLRFTGKDATEQRMEVVELARDMHPYFVATQFHPEFQSRPQRPAPVFRGFLDAVRHYNKSIHATGIPK